MRLVRWLSCAIIKLAGFLLASGLTIDNQLTIIRNDCYERMAIGEKLDPKDIDKTLTVSTVQECQMACTEEEEKCRSFSFGISVKGNATCELSNAVIKETPDLKPIGTVSDVDFDLYIKKLGCKLVLNENHHDKPLQYNYDKRPTAEYSTPKPPHYYEKPTTAHQSSYGTGQHVQSTFISVASGPNSPPNPPTPNKNHYDNHPPRYGTGRPYYPNSFSDRPNDHGFPDDRPPFRPSHLNHPYHYNENERPEYDRRPQRPWDSYGNGGDIHQHNSRPHRPDFIAEKPHTYGPEPEPQRPFDYGYKIKPYPSSPPIRDDYDASRPFRPHEIPETPNNYGPPRRPPHSLENPYGGQRPYRPLDIPERPFGDRYDDTDPSNYGKPKPVRPPEITDRPSSDGYGTRPTNELHYNHFYPHRPQHVPSNSDYAPSSPHQHPENSHRPTNYGDSKPYRPPEIPERPLGNRYGNPKPYRPPEIPERPLGNGYEDSRPHRPFEIPQRPLDDGYGGPRPHRPPEVFERPSSDGYGNLRPHRPTEIPRPPSDDGYGGDLRPHRPPEIPRPPSDDGYGGDSRPHRPPGIPRPPSDDGYGGGSRPHRPPEIPRPPSDDGYGGDSRPHRPPDIPRPPLDDDGYGGDSRPHRPPEIPRPPSDDGYGGDSRPHRPPEIPRPPLDDGYGRDSRPHRPPEIPRPPLEDGYGDARPHGPTKNGYESNRPHRPFHIPDRPPPPIGGGYEEHKPHRPFDVPDRPVGDGYGTFRPYRPPEIPPRPLGYDEVRPHRPFDVPHRPVSDGYDNPRPPKPLHIPERPLEDGYGGSRPSRPLDIPERPLYDYDSNYPPRHYRPVRPLEYDDPAWGPKPLKPDFDSNDQVYGYGSLSNTYGNRRVGYFGGYRLRPFHRRPPLNANNSSDYEKNKLNDDEKNNKTIPDDQFPNNFTSNVTVTSENVPKIPSSHKKPIVTHTQGPHGQTITSIITEITEACFRRVLAGKRVLGAFVRRTVPCERVEDCQRECSDEKRFVCEGFNYRLDPAGRVQGDCELLDLPLSRLNIRYDVVDDPDFDYYERDRNSDAPDCKGHKYYGSYGDYGYYQTDSKYDYYDYYGNGGYHDDLYRGEGGYRYNYRQPRPDEYDDGYRYYNSNRRGEYDTKDRSHNSYDYNTKYDDRPPPPPPPEDKYYYRPSYPPPEYDYKSYEPYLPNGYWKYERNGEYWRKYFDERVKDKNYWGFNKHYGSWGNYGGSYGNFGAPDSYYFYDEHQKRNNNRHDYDYYEYKYHPDPHEYGGSKDWGRYGGSYGYGGQRREYDTRERGYDYWGFKQYDKNGGDGLLPPYPDRPHLGGTYLPPYDEGPDYLDIEHRHDQHDHNYQYHIEEFDFHNLYKDECSLRMVTGFRLHKGIVKKLIAVPSIYECELLCYKEKDFPCNSYAYRYTAVPGVPLENCYLSDRNYKELDYYTDLEPDRDCDIYTLHNKDKCEQPVSPSRYNSDCFWRVRSGQRLDQRVVKDSLNVKSIVECQLECLRSLAFTCRGFSFRYGSSVNGGAIDNCQLTDWPFLDLDPRIHLIPEAGFELYERGSYGHGCEPYHFQIGKRPSQDPGDKLDQICYLGYGSPARLLPQATKKSITVETEAECKAECTKAREKSLFQCMSLSYRVQAPKGSPNCDLSDIVQRDLLSNVDYIADPDSWLFAWDLHNPRCLLYIAIGEGGNYGNSIKGNHVTSGGDSHVGNIGGSYGGGGGAGYGSGRPPHGGSGGSLIGSEGNLIDGGGYHGEIGKGSLIPWRNPGYPLETWRIYSVSGLPCKRGSLCQENKVAGFWYCELESREEHAWDYCCRPDHQCGYSEGFPYQWCHVGPGRTQWRKCSDRYYPYTNNVNDRFDPPNNHQHPGGVSYLPHSSDFRPPQRPVGFRPQRPAGHPPYLSQPSLDEYEAQFDNHFLDPPKPGGFGQSRHWPISYLHKEAPPNDTLAAEPQSDYMKVPKGRNIDSKYAAIANLIDVIKSNDLKDIRYQISNNSNKADDILYVQIPLPSNFSKDSKSEKLVNNNTDRSEDKLEAVDIFLPTPIPNSTTTLFTSTESSNVSKNDTTTAATKERKPRLYARSYVTRTNRTRNNSRPTRGSKGMIEMLPSP